MSWAVIRIDEEDSTSRTDAKDMADEHLVYPPDESFVILFIFWAVPATGVTRCLPKYVRDLGWKCSGRKQDGTAPELFLDCLR